MLQKNGAFLPRPKSLCAKWAYILRQNFKKMVQIMDYYELKPLPKLAKYALIIGLVLSPILMAIMCTYCLANRKDDFKDYEPLRPASHEIPTVPREIHKEVVGKEHSEVIEKTGSTVIVREEKETLSRVSAIKEELKIDEHKRGETDSAILEEDSSVSFAKKGK